MVNETDTVILLPLHLNNAPSVHLTFQLQRTGEDSYRIIEFGVIGDTPTPASGTPSGEDPPE